MRPVPATPRRVRKLTRRKEDHNARHPHAKMLHRMSYLPCSSSPWSSHFSASCPLLRRLGWITTSTLFILAVVAGVGGLVVRYTSKN